MPSELRGSDDAVVSRLAQQDTVPWYRKPNLRLLYLLMLPTCLGVEITSGFDASLLNGLQAVPSWLEYFQHPRSGLLGLMSAVYPLGGIIAAPFVPSIADKFGRRYSILIGSIFTMVGGVLQGAAFDFTMFIIARFILGFGIVFALVAASALIGELSHPKERAIMSSLFTASYMAGSISAAGVTLGTFAMPNSWGWRIPSLLQMVPSLFQLGFIWFLPESPRWLTSRGRGDEAYAILTKYHAEGDRHSDFVKAEYAQIEQTLGKELRNAQMSWMEGLSTAGMRKRVVIASSLALFTQMSGVGLIAYFLSPILDDIGISDNRTKNIINLVRACWSFANATIFALTVPRYPRRKMYLICTISLLVIMIAWTVASAEHSLTGSLVSSQVVLVLIFLHSPAYNLGLNALTYPFLVELFPFHVRAMGITIFNWWHRIAGFIAQFVHPIGIDTLGWKYYLIFCVMLAFEVGFVYLMFPETSGRTLEELTFLFECDRVSWNAETEPLLHEHRNGAETRDTISRKTSRAQHE